MLEYIWVYPRLSAWHLRLTDQSKIYAIQVYYGRGYSRPVAEGPEPQYNSPNKVTY